MDGSGLRLTTAKYYTPKGRSIQSTGIVPDIVVKLQPPVTIAKAGEKEREKEKEAEARTQKPKEKDTALVTPSRPGAEVISKGSGNATEAGGEGAQEEDLQLQKAVELLKTWKIFKELKPLEGQRPLESQRPL